MSALIHHSQAEQSINEQIQSDGAAPVQRYTEQLGLKGTCKIIVNLSTL